MWLGFVNSTAILENKSNKSPELLKEIVPERTSISVLRPTKDALESMKHPGQNYDGLVQELIKFYKEKSREYWTRRKAQRESRKG